MTTDNVYDLPNRHTLNHRRAAKLCEAFKAHGRRQPEVFENLSRHVERLVAETKARFGDKSGAMQRAFGPEFVRQKGRFTALNGQPPAKICKNPGNWLQVLDGLATELRRDKHALLSEVLEDALATNLRSGFGQDAWLAELDDLLAPMSEALAHEEDLPALADIISKSGLWLEDGKLAVSEWPLDCGFSTGGLYNPEVVGVVPHVWGLNYTPITTPSFDLTDEADFPLALDMLKANGVPDAAIAEAVRVEAVEAVRTGLAFAIRLETGEPELAILEWQISFLSLCGANGTVLSRHLANSGHQLPATIGGDVMAMYGASEDDFRTRPERWHPNSLRFHFRGTAGFDQMASSLVVAPWVYGDPDDLELILTADLQDVETYPLSSPVHTVAAAIESNLRYADDMGHPELRLDRLLAGKIRRIRGLVSDFRRAGEARRHTTREALLQEWKAATERNPSQATEGKE